MDFDKVEEIINRCNREVLVVSKSYSYEGLEPFWGLFERAELNQSENGNSIISRPKICAKTLRENICKFMSLSDLRKQEKANALLIESSNNLTELFDIQHLFGVDK